MKAWHQANFSIQYAALESLLPLPNPPASRVSQVFVYFEFLSEVPGLETISMASGQSHIAEAGEDD